MAIPAGLLLAPADSARAVGDVYGVSLLATLLLAAVWVSLVVLRRAHAGAGARALACRAAVAALLAISAGRFLPFHWIAWVVPAGLSEPLVALGRAQLTIAGVLPGSPGAGTLWRGVWTQGLLLLYWCGVAMFAVPIVRGRWRLHRTLRAAARCRSLEWDALLVDAARAARLSAGDAACARLFISRDVCVPMTWGSAARAVIVFPSTADDWTREERRVALVHELSHVRHGDARLALAARIARALYWFHPGAWWLAARMTEETELACDDRVLLSGVRPSDYVELLARALAGATGADHSALAGGVPLVRHTGLRARVAAIVDTSRVIRAPSRLAIAAVSVISAMVAVPIGAVRVAPTRDVLDTLMRDSRWESRAYAVVRLAQRADSVDVARDAARHDPSAQVRAWATYALAQRVVPPDAPVRQPSHDGTRAGLIGPTFLH